MLPSIKTLKTICPERAAELRSILEIANHEELATVLPKYPKTDSWYRSCYSRMELLTAIMSIADEILENHGVEYIPAGRNRKSPAIDYSNTGDTYAFTLLYVQGHGFRVGSWGDIVERGNYE